MTYPSQKGSECDMVMVANDQSALTGNALQWDESPSRHAMREKLAVRKSGETPASWRQRADVFNSRRNDEVR